MKTLADLLNNRPKREVFNPPIDKPFDQTAGGSPPYPFPPELISEMAGKSEEEISSLLSKFRTGLSEHRTRASEHRTDLSEHRTDLSGYRSKLSEERTDMSKHRTDLSEHRTALSEHRTDLSEHRTLLSDSRSLLSNERTHLGYVRTGLSLMTFGITLNRFALALLQGKSTGDAAEAQAVALRIRSTEQIGLGMLVLGVALLLWSLYRYKKVNDQILVNRLEPPRLSTITVTFLLVLLGGVTTVVLMFT
jgi:putative membrane protein